MVAINGEAAAVYLLDDDASILKATRRLLDSAWWNNVEIFTDPIAFLEHAEMHRPDLAVSTCLCRISTAWRCKSACDGFRPRHA